MLNTENIAKKIKNPELITSDDLSSLENLSIKYPYSQIFSILYLKGLGITKNIRFEEELKNHSYKVTDRVQLYELINEYSNDISISNPPSSKYISSLIIRICWLESISIFPSKSGLKYPI